MTSRISSYVAITLLMFSLSVPAASQSIRSGPRTFVTPLSLTFPAQAVGTRSAAMSITVSNAIPGYLFLTIVTSGPYQSSGCAGGLAPHQSCTISVTFAPNAVGIVSGWLRVSSPGTAFPSVVTLSGTGVAAAATNSAPDSVGTSAAPLAASQHAAKHPRYRLIDLGTFGGPQNYVNIPDISDAQVLNNRGMVAGWADTSEPDPYPDFCVDADCFVAHAFQWQHGVKKDLGVLPGGASSQANWISDNGLIAGTSQNGQIDPLVPGFPEFRAVLWKKGDIVDLGTLEGGYESIATAVNSRGQVVGFATNTIPDANSMFGLGYQTRAFLWQNGLMQDLGTLGPDTNAVAFLVNEPGQVVGESYVSSDPSALCSEIGFPLATGAFLWEKGKMVDLGNFGGTCTFASDLNNRGQVVGGSRLARDQVQHPFLWDRGSLIDLGTFGGDLGNAIAINEAGDVVGWATYPGDEAAHAALWRHGKKQDLGTLGDPNSIGYDINASGQVVGISANSDFSQTRVFLWENGGPMVDLNALIPAGSDLQLVTPETINDRGEIAGSGVLPDGSEHAFLLIPCNADHGGTKGCEDASQQGNAFQTEPAPTSPAMTVTQPKLIPSGMVAGSRARLARRYRIPTLRTPK